MRVLKAASVLMVALALASLTAGSTYIIHKPEVVIKNAPLIIEAIVKDLQYKPVPGMSVGEAWVTLTVVDRIVGDCPAEVLIRRFNVTPDLRFLETDWEPAFAVGERFIICLSLTPNGYSRMGLYNGKFIIENGAVKGTQISLESFKGQVLEIRSGRRSTLPDEMPRQTAHSRNDRPLQKQGMESTVTSAGFHLNYGFRTFDFTWNPSSLPVQMHYNPSGAPANAPNVNSISTLAQISYSFWTDPFSSLTYQNASPFTTTAGIVRDSYSVIAWFDPGSTGHLGKTDVFPNDPERSIFYGPNSNTGTDIWFNPNIVGAWYFGTTPPSVRDSSQYDFVEVLAHELGHSLGLWDLEVTDEMMYAGYLDSSLPIRGQGQGDLAGRVYQHAKATLDITSSPPHSIVLSALANRTVNITGLISIPAGITFQLESSTASVHLTPGSWIKATGGSLIDDGGNNMWSPNLKRKSGTTLLGCYSRLEDAVGDASSGQVISFSSGKDTLHRNVTVPSGVTLVLTGVVSVNLNGFNLSSSGGTITTESGVTISGVHVWSNSAHKGWYPTIQGAVNAATGNQYVDIPSGTFNENVTINNKNNILLRGAGTSSTTINGTVSCYGCYNFWPGGFYCNGFTATYCDLGNFTADVYGGGEALYSSSGFTQWGIICSSTTGLTASYSSGSVGASSFYAENGTGISASGSTNVQVDRSNLCSSVTYDFAASNSGHIGVTQNGYWCRYGIPRYTTSSGGTVTIPATLVCSMAKSTVSETGSAPEGEVSPTPFAGQGEGEDSTAAAFAGLNREFFTLQGALQAQAQKAPLASLETTPFQASYQSLAKRLEAFVREHPSSPLARVALLSVTHSARWFSDEAARKSFLDEILTSKELAPLNTLAKSLLIDYYRSVHDLTQALSTADELIRAGTSDPETAADALLKKALLLAYQLNKPAEAEASFAAILDGFPGTAAAVFASRELDLLKAAAGKEAPAVLPINEGAGFSLSSFPNPFNPTTVIRYKLPEEGKVSLTIYDVLGKEVTRLVNAYQAAGTYAVSFDGSLLASGVYFCRLQAGLHAEVKKLLLAR